MVIVTGAAGFIGSQIANHLSGDLLLVDKGEQFKKTHYVDTLVPADRLIEADDVFFERLKELKNVSWIVHMGAITNTAEKDVTALAKWNVDYTKRIWEHCAKNKINLIYASSAATYGDGLNGFSDDHARIPSLKPLNPYGQSKQDFDLYALDRAAGNGSGSGQLRPPHWYGLKFFNVYGPNENHKGRMASAVWHGYNQIKDSSSMTLFRSHRSDVKDGDQARDFIYVGDVLKVIDFLMAKQPASGIYNLGTGRAGTFLELAEALFSAMGKPVKINWVDTPPEFRAAYQYKTEADMKKLRAAGFTQPFTALSEGISKYLAAL